MNRIICAVSALAGTVALSACGDDVLGAVNNGAPVADAGGDRVVETGAYLTFDGSRSDDPDGDALTFTWDIAGGETNDGETFGYVFESAGEHAVTLIVEDPHGLSDTDTIVVTVVAPAANEAPTARITGPDTALVGELVELDGFSSSDDASVTGFTWDVAGTAASGAVVEHRFTTAGTFTVSLVVVDEQGLRGEATHTITVETIVPEPATLTGTWSWTLVDESQRDLGFTCGTFYDSTLLIDADSAPTLHITEQASLVSNTYTGTLTDTAFDVVYESLGVEQRIFGSFTSETTFEGTYQVSPLGQSCADRAVTGTRTP